MTHHRQQIREAIVATLDAIPSLDGRVVSTRAQPTKTNDLPVAIVYTLTESAERTSLGGRLLRSLSAAIEIRVSTAGRIDDTLDGFCASVEQAMAANRTLSRTATDSVLASTTIGIDGEGESRQALATLVYTITYQTSGAGT